MKVYRPVDPYNGIDKEEGERFNEDVQSVVSKSSRRSKRIKVTENAIKSKNKWILNEVKRPKTWETVSKEVDKNISKENGLFEILGGKTGTEIKIEDQPLEDYDEQREQE